MKTYQIYCDRGNGNELDGCWGSEDARFDTRKEAEEAAKGLAEMYPDCEWNVEEEDTGAAFITIYAGDHVSRKEAEHETVEAAHAWCADQGCESDWSGQDSRTPSVKGYTLRDIFHEGENCIWCWVFENDSNE